MCRTTILCNADLLALPAFKGERCLAAERARHKATELANGETCDILAIDRLQYIALLHLVDAGAAVVPCLLRCRRLTLPSSRASLNSMARNWLIMGEANTLLGYLVPLA